MKDPMGKRRAASQNGMALITALMLLAFFDDCRRCLAVEHDGRHANRNELPNQRPTFVRR